MVPGRIMSKKSFVRISSRCSGVSSLKNLSTTSLPWPSQAHITVFVSWFTTVVM